MSRARVAALALVNWKGVFYERYLLDRHVTALEGANGAGKTTVMIAAYVALLPDMQRLRFTNVGESGASGGDRGLWGRLGELGRPSYTALDLVLADGARLVAGVRLVRGGEPTIEPTPFMIEGLGAEVPLSDLLLVRDGAVDQVPELDEIRAAAKRHGGKLEVFRASKDYFAALFERGVTPLRLATDEERGKLNEMLRTSMTGGISRALTSELRAFLLKEETGLGDTLGHMRANLDACRRTRGEVAEARVLEREISGVYDAGQAMFAAELHAARLGADEAAARLAAAAAAAASAAREVERLFAEVGELDARQGMLDARVVTARAEHERILTTWDRAKTAAGLAAKLAAVDEELAVIGHRAEATRAAQAAASADREARRQARGHAHEAYEKAALGLAHLQGGLDELHRRAQAHRQLGRALDEARGLLDRPALSIDEVPAALGHVVELRERQRGERAKLERGRRDLEVARGEHARAVAALEVVEAAASAYAMTHPGGPAHAATPLAGDGLHARARTALARLAEREAGLPRIAEREAELGEASRLAERQRAAHTRAAALGLTPGPGAATALEARLDEDDRALREAEGAARAGDEAAEAARTRLGEVRHRRATVGDRALRYQAAAPAAARLGGALGLTPTSAGELQRARLQLGEAQLEAATRKAEVEAARERDLRLAAELEGPGAALDPELARLRDELGGEFLLERFDDLDAAAAATMEARLGPLDQALIVAEPLVAAAALRDKPRGLPTVWLVKAGVELTADEPAKSGDVVVVEPFGARVTRRPAVPTLGARARAARAKALRAAAEEAGQELDGLVERGHRLAALARDLDVVAGGLDVLGGGDPAVEAAALDEEQRALTEAERTARDGATAARVQVTARRAAVDGLRRLLGEALLLEPPDHGARATALAAAIASARQLRGELDAIATARATLAELLEVLRAPPPTAAEAATAALRQGALDAALDRLYRAGAALEDVLALRHAAGWGDAAEALASSAALVPALEVQHTAARQAVQAADHGVTEAEAGWERATAAAQEAEGVRAAAVAQRERLAAELVELGGAALAEASEQATDAVSKAGERLAELELEARALVGATAAARERLAQTERRAQAAVSAVKDEQLRSDPAAHGWTAMREAIAAAGLELGAPPVEGPAAELHAEARSKRALLVDRVGRSRGGDELARALRGDDGIALGTIDAWLQTRDWLRRRVPTQVATADEPLLALERLRDHLDVLDRRLQRQEGDLRGASEDVARRLDVQLRRARGQVRRLNQHLEGVRFGSIAAIRVELRRIDRMEQILRALRDGEAQELLFLPSLPIEEALDEIFKRYGGGGRSGGMRLLDYREYLELVVEIRRQTSEAWEPASPTRLSTGEAIGVGAALMMVVLTEWERDANLLRSRATPGSLRFLFLDEANRLSRDNLGVLFELCRILELQLMIAAPEVARSEGVTTYRLVRHLTEDGREEVIVSGRRAIATEATADAGAGGAGEGEAEEETNVAVDEARLEAGQGAAVKEADAATPEAVAPSVGDAAGDQAAVGERVAPAAPSPASEPGEPVVEAVPVEISDEAPTIAVALSARPLDASTAHPARAKPRKRVHTPPAVPVNQGSLFDLGRPPSPAPAPAEAATPSPAAERPTAAPPAPRVVAPLDDVDDDPYVFEDPDAPPEE